MPCSGGLRWSHGTEIDAVRRHACSPEVSAKSAPVAMGFRVALSSAGGELEVFAVRPPFPPREVAEAKRRAEEAEQTAAAVRIQAAVGEGRPPSEPVSTFRSLPPVPPPPPTPSAPEHAVARERGSLSRQPGDAAGRGCTAQVSPEGPRAKTANPRAQRLNLPAQL